jgi:hypothetical protein
LDFLIASNISGSGTTRVGQYILVHETPFSKLIVFPVIV